jgi:ubiquinone biosynthesis protein
MERLQGYSIAKRERMIADGVDPKAFAALFAGTMLNMVFRDGFYHADPHPGNIFVLPGGRLGMLDCGKVGRVDERTQDEFISIVTAFLSGDVDALTDELVQMCEAPTAPTWPTSWASSATFPAGWTWGPPSSRCLASSAATG